MSTVTLGMDARGVATVTLDRPDRHNAMNARMIADLDALAGTLAQDRSVRVVVLTGAGRSFSAGADLGWMQQQIDADAQTRAAGARALAQMLGRWNTLPKPVIARVQGNAFGGGLGLISVCDVAVAAQGAKFGLTETRLGLIPATIGPYVLARMGEGKARRVFMSARLFDAAEAVTLDLIARAVPADLLDAATEAEVAPYLLTAPGAVAEAKALARSLGPVIDSATIERSVQALITRWQSTESTEGIAAFFEKRPAQWV